ncbi:MAG: hypothetical protein KYX67_08550 [Brevundimonas sp.]|uniref:hypothetical protein n=1 Tax=Brevundimonas sp. TaxID=1871086 RepID=UPI00256B3FF1|nr:hypothetical protein [Brevundimonas sp.]MDK2747354.1 hypothetical protein [Brevundimonas sp.]
MMRFATLAALAAAAVLAQTAWAQTAWAQTASAQTASPQADGKDKAPPSRLADTPSEAPARSEDAPAEVAVGATARGSSGEALGQVVGVSRGSGGRVDGYLIRLPDGSTRLLPADAATVQGGVLIAAQGDFRPAPVAQ